MYTTVGIYTQDVRKLNKVTLLCQTTSLTLRLC